MTWFKWGLFPIKHRLWTVSWRTCYLSLYLCFCDELGLLQCVKMLTFQLHFGMWTKLHRSKSGKWGRWGAKVKSVWTKKPACWVGTRWLSGKQFWLFPLNVLPQLPQDITVKLSVCSLTLGDTFRVHDIMTVGKTNTKGAHPQSDSSHFMLPSGFLCIHFNSVLFM